MKKLFLVMTACLACMWSSASSGNEPVRDGLHLQIEPMYIGVTGMRENLGDLANQGTPLVVDPSNDLRLRGEISYRWGNWRFGANGWWLNTDYELRVVGAAPVAANVAQTKVSFWSGGPFVDYKMFGQADKELFLQLGVKLSQSQQRLWGQETRLVPLGPTNINISYADVDILAGPNFGIKGQMNLSKKAVLQGYVTQAVSFGRVNRSVLHNWVSVASSGATVCIPITEATLKVSYYFTPNIGVGLGGLLSVWYAVPSPPRPTASGQWKNSNGNLVFTGLLFALEGKW
jgi:hypothetical protein